MSPRELTRFRLIPTLFFAVICFSSTGLLALAQVQNNTPPVNLKTFDIKSDPEFRNYKNAVTDYAKVKRSKAPSDFCILGYMTGDNLKNAFVIWRQGDQIIVWYGGNQPLTDSQRIINLRSDVVPTEDDLHGSTYLVTKGWVGEVTAACNREGVKVHVPKQ